MAKHLIDLSVDARYEGNASDITQFTNGQPATADVFNAPPQNLRQRVETLRQEVEDLKYVADADRAMVLAIEGTLTATVISNKFSLSMSGSSPYLLIRPFISTVDAVGSGVLSVGGTALITLSIDTSAGAPKAWGQYDDSAWGPATRGANAIKVKFELRTGSDVTVAAGDEAYELVVGVPVGTTAGALATALEAASQAVDLHLLAAAVSGQSSTAITLTSGSPITVEIAGAADAEAHKIPEAALETFFYTDSGANKLEDGDTLAIWYDTLVDSENGSGGRRQRTVDSTVSDTSLFNTRLEPSKIPGCIPVATVVGDKLFLIDGTVMTDGESIGGSGSEYLPTAGGTVSGNLTVQGNTTLGDSGTDVTLVQGVLRVGEPGDPAGSEPFRVTKDGAVTAASVATGAITATSLDAGSGTIQTTGTAKAADAVVSGTLGVGAATYGASEFRVTEAGAVTAASINAGAGTIETTGAVNSGSLTVTGATTLGTGDLADDVLIKGSGDTFGVGSSGTTGVAAAPFRVTSAGAVFAVDSNVSGKFSVGASNYNDAPVKIIDSGVTTPAVTAGAATLNVSEAGQTTAVLGNLDVAGTLKAGTDDKFQVDAAGAVTAVSVTLGDTDANPAGSLTIYNESLTIPPISVKNSLGQNVISVNSPAHLELGTAEAQAPINGSVTINTELNNSTAALLVTDSAQTIKFKVAHSGATEVGGALNATGLSIGGTALFVPQYYEFFLNGSSTIGISGTSPWGTTQYLASGLVAGVYRVTVALSYNDGGNDEEHDFALISAAQRAANSTAQPSTLSANNTASYVTIAHSNSSNNRLLVIERILTLAANGTIVLVGYKSVPGGITPTAHGSVIWHRIA